MKKLLYILATAVIAATACTSQPDKTVIKIKTHNYDAEHVNLGWAAPGGPQRDTLWLIDGKAEKVLNVPDFTPLYLYSFDSRSGQMLDGRVVPVQFSFYAEKGTITIILNGEKWPELTIKGGPLSNDMNRYWKELGPRQMKLVEESRRRTAAHAAGDTLTDLAESRKLQEERARTEEAFIAGNPNSALALELLSRRFEQYTRNYKYNTLDEFDTLLNNLNGELKNSDKGIALAGKIDRAKGLSLGSPAPSFTKKDKDGKDISLAGYAGKYVLLDFWGSWCNPCRKSHPHLVELYNKYAKRGLEFINIAQEQGKGDPREKWLKAIATDGLVWTQILNNEGEVECNLVELYKISAYPTKILIDPQGNIVAIWKGDSHELDEKLKEIFGS